MLSMLSHAIIIVIDFMVLDINMYVFRIRVRAHFESEVDQNRFMSANMISIE